MALPARIRVNASVPFPSLVQGSGPITVNKVNGVWTVGFAFQNFPTINPPVDPTAYYTMVYNPTSNTYSILTIASFYASIYVGAVVVITGSGTVTVTPANTAIILNKSIAGATTINLPSVASRNGLPLLIADYAGNAGDITINALGSDAIMGVAAWTLTSTGGAGFGGSIRLFPVAGVGWVVNSP